MLCALITRAAAPLLALFVQAPAPVSTSQASQVTAPPTFVIAPPAANQPAADPSFVLPKDDGRGTPYKVAKDDNICGLSEPRQLTNPAKVDYQALLDATSEMEELKRKKIDPASAKGIELTTKARNRVRDACEAVRTDKRHCSIWKTIARRDKVAVADVTTAVKAKL